ncbi:MAG: hypothetical protein IJ426_03475 [Clostridia bacterium]|nr:hypothetical protein [Alistipes sp.]MBQ8550379.1 hypothetical protein [Clostridia bacterium]
MKKCADNIVYNATFESGELYLFNIEDPQCPPDRSLWGIFDRQDGDQIFLESGTTDHTSFDLWFALPRSYHFYRLATRSELRDYIYNIATFEAEKHSQAPTAEAHKER